MSGANGSASPTPVVPLVEPAAGFAAGHWLVGELHGLRPGTPFGPDDRKRYPHELGLIVGGELVVVQYVDEASCKAAVGGMQRGDSVAVRVNHKFGARKDGTLWSFFTAARDGVTADLGGWE